MAEFKLIRGIIALSQSNTWDAAKLEWKLNDVYEVDEPETCLCGHFPIKEICMLHNSESDNSAKVGNCCVKKFIGLPSDKIFQAVRRVRKDSNKSLNPEALKHAKDKGWINDWEYNFSIDTFRKINLNENQLTKRRQINEKILQRMKRK